MRNRVVEEKKEADGWEKYTVIGILGEGSYGKVYKVIRKDSEENSEKSQHKTKKTTLGAYVRRITKAPEFFVIKEL